MDSPDPFTPGFGPFQGIPNRTLPDDCMEYTLLVPPSPSSQRRLEAIQALAAELTAQWSEGYIWQREGFGLELVQKGDAGTWCLQGRTEYGDSVDDEWFIVWMLRELSARFEDLWIRVYDTDGEFLLIEAANALPKWLNPEIADYRVWIHRTQLLIIPLSAAAATTTTSRTAPISRPLTLTEALAAIAAAPTTPIPRIRLIEEEAFYRTSRYPTPALPSHHHHALLTLPRTLAHILHKHPASVAAAVEAFYLRDPISLKALTSKTPLFAPGTDDVLVSVKLTKILYAQLKMQEFRPPPGCAFRLPAEGSSDYNACDVGMKLTCGFEMLLSDAGAPQLSSASRRRTVAAVRGELLDAPPLLLPSDAEIAAWPQKADTEEWLDVDYAEFEHTLLGKSGAAGRKGEGAGGGGGGWGDKGAEENLKRMVERFEAFLNDDSAGVDGAEVGDDDGDDMDRDNDSDEEELNSDDDDDDEYDEDGEDREVSFDEREFERMMREMMGMPTSTLDGEGEGEDNEEAEIRKVMSQVEAELREAGALETAAPRIKEVGDGSDGDEEEEEEEGEGEVNIDYTLAANMLESFKGQGGLAGPGGNLLARMGMSFPRDEGERDDGKGKGREIGGQRMK